MMIGTDTELLVLHWTVVVLSLLVIALAILLRAHVLRVRNLWIIQQETNDQFARTFEALNTVLKWHSQMFEGSYLEFLEKAREADVESTFPPRPPSIS